MDIAKQYVTKFDITINNGAGNKGILTRTVVITSYVVGIIFVCAYLVSLCMFFNSTGTAMFDLHKLAPLKGLCITLTALTSTFSTLIYTHCIFLSGGKEKQSDEAEEKITPKTRNWRLYLLYFIDVTGDGKVDGEDLLCILAALNSLLVVTVDCVLWFNGILLISEKVSVVNGMHRVIIVFLTKSFLVHKSSHLAKPTHRYLNLIDILAIVFQGIFWMLASHTWYQLIFVYPWDGPKHADLVSLCSSMTGIFMTIVMTSLTSSKQISQLKRTLISVFSLMYVALVLKTVANIYLNNAPFNDEIAKFGKELVVPVTTTLTSILLLKDKISLSEKKKC